MHQSRYTSARVNCQPENTPEPLRTQVFQISKMVIFPTRFCISAIELKKQLPLNRSGCLAKNSVRNIHIHSLCMCVSNRQTARAVC